MIKDTGPPTAKHSKLLALVRRARTVLSALGKDLPNTTLILALTALLVEEAQAATKSDAASAADAAKKAAKEIRKNKFDPKPQIEYINNRFSGENAMNQWMELDRIIGEMP